MCLSYYLFATSLSDAHEIGEGGGGEGESFDSFIIFGKSNVYLYRTSMRPGIAITPFLTAIRNVIYTPMISSVYILNSLESSV